MENSTYVTYPYYVPPVNSCRDFRNCFFDSEKKLIKYSVFDACYEQSFAKKIDLFDGQFPDFSDIEIIKKKLYM